MRCASLRIKRVKPSLYQCLLLIVCYPHLVKNLGSKAIVRTRQTVQIAAGCRNIAVAKPLHDLLNGRPRCEHGQRKGVPCGVDLRHAKITLEDICQSSLREGLMVAFMRKG